MYSNGHDELRYRHNQSSVVSDRNAMTPLMEGGGGGAGVVGSGVNGEGGSGQNGQGGPLTPNQRQAQSRARRAERARMRYHSMRPEVRQQQNARRAELLRKSRQRDEELVRLAERINSPEIPPDTREAILNAQERRSRRAEQARAKYHRMNSEERRQYNAMRDAQRRQRKRQQESRGHHGAVRGLSEGRSNNSGSLSPPPHQQRCLADEDGAAPGEQVEVEQIGFGDGYDMYDQPMPGWEQ